jgi:small-conductance mechanosensitive channel
VAETAATEKGTSDVLQTDEAAGPIEEAIQDELLDSMVFDMLPSGLQEFLDVLSNHPLLLIMVLVSVGYLVGKLFQFLLTSVLSRLAARTEADYDDRLLEIARRPALTVPMMLSLLLVTSLIMEGGSHRFLVGFLSTLMLLSILRAALKSTHILLELVASKEGKHDFIQPRTMPMFEISTKLLLVALAIYIMLLIWGINPTAWLASAGVVGIAVGFAARDTLANLFSGIFIVADAPYKIGDYIVLDTGERGEVTALGMRSTRLLTRDDIEITIPNAIIANAKIINESGGPWEKHRIRIPIGVAYGSDLDQVIELLMKMAADHDEIIDYPAPRVRMRRFGESSIDFELLGWIERPFMRGRVKHDMLMAIYGCFNEAGVQIPFPQRDVHLRKEPD